MGKQRPRFAKRGDFVSVRNPEKTVNYETWALSCYMDAHGDKPKMEGPIEIQITAYFPIPKAKQTIKWMERMLRGTFLPLVKPDVDNISKLILDALNLYAYDDDKQVTDLHIQKRYGVIPRVEVVLIPKETEEAD